METQRPSVFAPLDSITAFPGSFDSDRGKQVLERAFGSQRDAKTKQKNILTYPAIPFLDRRGARIVKEKVLNIIVRE